MCVICASCACVYECVSTTINIPKYVLPCGTKRFWRALSRVVAGVERLDGRAGEQAHELRQAGDDGLAGLDDHGLLSLDVRLVGHVILI